ncbi:MAG TPA: superoxide dismutase [Candidatus Nanoperiomorbaceae bacterium]|nr:superoxide dismutase [Candidatus Nanoperiomorbaceae bacterium]HMQ96837.1 superoxide dismutase [Candidatus Nanoperiomorbaceae bacterium]HMR86310.1 superoxide dismutase [Candidatus Nanoperiomorbaceae bacterium]HMU11875.1 superoxide dismutase [Candidatus Nanoperiomorbaceae bacterium]
MYKLPDLDYDYDALGTYISGDIMHLHHDNHHQTYVNKLNEALDQVPELQTRELTDLLANLESVPESVRTAVRNHGGGHYNHSQFWKWLTPNGNGEPTGQLKENLVEKYGSFQAFVDEFSAKSLAVFGSGWCWLLPDLSIVTTPNQDVPLEIGEPILGLDVWEHAYYLDYTYNRGDYVKSWWNVVNWPEVENRYLSSVR